VSNATVNRTLEVVRAILRKKINLSRAFAGQRVGVKQVEEKIWLVSFMRYDLGFFDHETCRIESAANPFAARLSPMSPV
jgi:putative transposase